MTEETHEEYLTRQDALAAEQANHSVAWDRARATFWQAASTSAATIGIGSQVATWGELGAQAAAAGLTIVVAVANGVLAGALAYARWRGGTPKNTH